MKKKNFITLLLGLIIVFLFIYKWYEWKTLKDLSSLYSNSITHELRLTSNLSFKTEDKTNKILLFYESASKSAELFESAYSNLDSSLNLYKSEHADYLKLNREDRKSYKLISNQLNYLYISNIDLAKKIVSNQLKYYDQEIKGAEEEAIITSFYKNLMMVFYDSGKINNFNKIALNKTLVKDKFSMLATIAKYSEGSFKFENEDQIKNYAPEEYKILTKYKRYFSTFYELMKMLVKDQETSQNYKNVWSKLQQDMTNLNFDFKNLFSYKKDYQIERAKTITALISEQIEAVYSVNRNVTYRYPFLGNVIFSKHELWQCQLYGYKGWLFFYFYKTYPTSNSTDEYIREISKISPKTGNIDTYFNKKLLFVDNNDKYFTYTCNDPDNNDSYIFKGLK